MELEHQAPKGSLLPPLMLARESPGEASENSSQRNTNYYTILNSEGSFVVSEVVVFPFVFILHCAAVH